MWLAMCRNMQVKIPPAAQNYQEILQSWAERFRGFRASYERTWDVFRRLESALASKNAIVGRGLTQAVTRAEFDQICEKLKTKLKLECPASEVLPPDVACWYLITNTLRRVATPLFGALECYNMLMTGHPTSFMGLGSTSFGPNDRSILIAAPYMRLSLEDMGDIKRGNIWVSQAFNDEEELEDNEVSGLVIAETFIDYVENYVAMLEQGYLEAHPRFGISKWPIKGIPTQITNDIKVTAAHVHHPASHSPTYLFMYQITISMDSDAVNRHTSKLETRHWEIVDLNGRRDQVDGPGVIGQYPEIGPGKSFSYASCCPLTTPGGTMSGHFTMRDLTTNETWQLIVPRMNFAIQRVITQQTIAAGDFQTS